MIRGRKPYIPLYIDLTGKKVLVAGSGETAAKLIRYLAAYADDLYLLTQEEPDRGSIPPGGVTVLRKPYERSDLYGMDYVISVTGDRAVDEDIHAACRTLGIRVHIASEPGRCDFFLEP